MGPRISVVINTLNEEQRLPFALRSVSTWADEIIVVDMYSDDRTVDVAREFGATVFLHERSAVVEAARGFAIARARCDWVLLLDADELIPAALAQRLRTIAREDRFDVVRIPRLNYLLGAALQRTGWGPMQDLQWRFFRPGCMEASEAIHNGLRPVANARVLALNDAPDLAIVHFVYLDVEHFLAKLNRYTTVEALQARERGGHVTPLGALARALKEFLARYLRHGGFRDGWRGFYLSLLMAFYRLVSAAKLSELEHGVTREEVRTRYDEEAERLLAEFSTRQQPV